MIPLKVEFWGALCLCLAFKELSCNDFKLKVFLINDGIEITGWITKHQIKVKYDFDFNWSSQ